MSDKKTKTMPDTSSKSKKAMKTPPSTSAQALPEHAHSFSISSETELDLDFLLKNEDFGGVLEVVAPEWWQEETLVYAMGQGRYQLAEKRLLSARLWKPQSSMVHKYLLIQVAQHKTLHKTVVLTKWGNSGVGRIPSRSEDVFEGKDAKEKAIEKFKSIFSSRTGNNFDSPPELMNQSSYQIYTTESPKIAELENISDLVLPIPLPGFQSTVSTLPSTGVIDSSSMDVAAAAEAASLALFSPKTKKKPKRVREVVSDEDDDEKVKVTNEEVKSLHSLKEKLPTSEALVEKTKFLHALQEKLTTSHPLVEKVLQKKQKTSSAFPTSLHTPSTHDKQSSSSLPLVVSSSSLSSKAFALRLSLPQQQDDEQVEFTKSSLPSSVTDLLHSCVSNGAISELVARLGVSARKLNLGGDAHIALEKAANTLSNIASLVLVRSRNEFDDESKSHEEREDARNHSRKAITEQSRIFRSLIPLSTSNQASLGVQVDLEKTPSSWTSLPVTVEERNENDGVATDGVATTTTLLDSFSALSSACRVVDLLQLLNSSASAVLSVRRQHYSFYKKQEAAGKTIKKLPNSADLLLQTSLSWIEPLHEQQTSFLTIKKVFASFHVAVESAFLCNLYPDAPFLSSLDSKLFWFTAPKCALPGILSSGLPSPSSSSSITVYPYGKGIYLSSSPSDAYKSARQLEPTGSVHLYLVEVGADTNVRTTDTVIHEDTSKGMTVIIQGKQSTRRNDELRLMDVDGTLEIVIRGGESRVHGSDGSVDDATSVTVNRSEEEERRGDCEFDQVCARKEILRIRYLLVCNEEN